METKPVEMERYDDQRVVMLNHTNASFVCTNRMSMAVLCTSYNFDCIGVLWHLGTRFAEDHIYTNVGNILISINPFKMVNCS